MNRKTVYAALTAATLLSLTACSSTADDAATPADAKAADCTLSSGKVTESVKVSGDHGAQDVTAKFETPAKVDSQELKVLDKGDGQKIVVSESVLYTANASVFNGSTGEIITSEPIVGMSLQPDSGYPAWITNAISCAATNESRVVTALPATDIWSDPEGAGVPKLTAKDSVVVVVDLQGTAPGYLDSDKLLSKAEGRAVDLPAGFPEVTVAENGEPAITIPKDLPRPTELKVANLIEGDGETVEPGDRVYVHYRGVIWSTGEEFDSSWSRGAPADFTTDGVIAGFREALVGQKVGSRVVALVDPESGYGADWLTERGYEADDVMVFVLDVLGTVPAGK